MFLFRSPRNGTLARLSRLNDNWQEDLKLTPLAGRTHKIDCAAVISNDPLNNGEPQATAGEFRAEERIEDSSLHLFGHTATRIRDLQVHVISRRQIRWTVC